MQVGISPTSLLTNFANVNELLLLVKMPATATVVLFTLVPCML